MLSALAFRAVGVESPSSMEARFRVRGRNYLSVRFIFRISDVKGQLDGFSWLVKNRLTSVQLKTLNSLVCFSQVQNYYPEALRPFTNALIISLPGQRYWKTVRCSAACEGNDQWRL